MSALKSWLDRKRKPDTFAGGISLYALLYSGTSWKYPLKRFFRPLIGASYRSGIGLLFWSHVSDALPLFSWNDLFSWIQVLFLIDFVISALLETLRAELRAKALAGRGPSPIGAHLWPWTGVLALAPFLFACTRIAFALTHWGRYFGLYDAITLILLGRFWLSTLQRVELGMAIPGRRVPLFTWNWLIPPLIAPGVFIFLERHSAPDALVAGLLAETAVQFAFQFRRRLSIDRDLCPQELLRRYRAFLFPPGFRALLIPKKLVPGLLRRLALLPVFGAVHLALLVIYSNPDPDREMVVLLHSISPLLSLVSRGGLLYWKDRLDSTGEDLFSISIRRRLLHFAAITAFLFLGFAAVAAQTGALADEVARVIALTGLIHLCTYLSLDPWLGFHFRIREVLPPCVILFLLFLNPLPDPATGVAVAGVLFAWFRIESRNEKQAFTHRIGLRRRFWSESIREPALMELRALKIPHRADEKGLLVSLEQPGSGSALLSWGRGWIHTVTRLPESGVSGNSTPDLEVPVQSNDPEFDLVSLGWIRRPASMPQDPSLKHAIFKSLHRGLTRGLVRGRAGDAENRISWKRHGSRVRVREQKNPAPFHL